MKSNYSQISLIINADDFGLHPSINAGIIVCALKHRLSSASVLVNAPYVNEVKQFASNLPSFDLGIHLSLENIPPETHNYTRLTKLLLDQFHQQMEHFIRMFHHKPSNLSLHQGAILRDFLENPIGSLVLQSAISIIEHDMRIVLRSRLSDHLLTLNPEEPARELVKKILRVPKHHPQGKNVIIIAHPARQLSTTIPLQSAYPLAKRYIEYVLLTNTIFDHMLNMKAVKLINFIERNDVYEKNNQKTIQ